CDALLICAGIFFAAIATTAGGWAVNSLLVAGAGYLLWFGAKAAKASWRGDSLSAGGISPKTAKGAFAASLALSLLNPHAILDMSIIFGGIAAQMPTEEKPFFALGGIIMSFVWFFALGFGAEKLSPWLTKPVAWRFINGGIALLMVSIAAALLTKLVTETLL
ncbi:MAG: LysE/ArgO family amino acid transporter, partial [Gammaproteobacteria bacterium WSBS_2016_MAG_OTU1]